MLPLETRSERLVGILPGDQTRREIFLQAWQPIDVASVRSDLVPEFFAIFTAVGLHPTFVTQSWDEAYGPVAQYVRNIIVDSDNSLLFPGIQVTEVTPRSSAKRVIDLKLMFDVNQEFKKSLSDAQIPDDTPHAFNPPYWWPNTYPSSVVDSTYYQAFETSVFYRSAPVDVYDGGEEGISVQVPYRGFVRNWRDYDKEVASFFLKLKQRLISLLTGKVA